MKHLVLFLVIFLPFCSFAQFAEDFSNDELAAGWLGNRDSFAINSDHQLQLKIKNPAGGTAYLKHSIKYSTSMEWNIDIIAKSSATKANRLNIYLYRETEAVYYYLRFGYDTKDKLALVRIDAKGDTTELVHRATKDFNSAPLTLSLKVTLDNNRRWTLYSRLNNASEYTTEGTCDYEIAHPATSGYLNLNFNFTSSNYNRFAVDNIKVSDRKDSENDDENGEKDDDKPTEPDNGGNGGGDKPSEPGDNQDGGNQGGDDGNKDDDKDGDSGNTDDSKPETIAFGAVRINEIMAKPGNDWIEYVEVYNTGSKSVSMKGWHFIRVSGNVSKTIGEATIPAKGYAVMFNSSKAITLPDAAVSVPIEKFPALSDGGTTLKLTDANGAAMDSAAYVKATEGISWESDGKNWHLCSDARGGTPGAMNSSASTDNPGDKEPEEPEEPTNPATPTSTVSPKQIVINELLPNPATDGSEYFELYNRSEEALSMSGLSVAIRRSDGSLSTKYPLSSVSAKIEANGFALLTKSKSGVTQFFKILAPQNIHEVEKLPILANTASTLVLLRSADETVIDEVSYSSKWHSSSVKDEKGVALERISPDDDSQSASNWTSAAEVSGFGTPGYQNSQFGRANTEDKSTGISAPEWIEEEGAYFITYKMEKSGFACRAYIFDLSGRRVGTVIDRQTLGTQGRISWDGFANGHSLHEGVYVFFAELYHDDGTVRRIRKPFLIR